MITLKQFDRNDFERLINWVDNEEILVQFGGPLFSFPLTNQQLEDYINDIKRLSYRVVELTNKETIGHAELLPSDNNKTIKICRVLIGDKSRRGQGLGQQIINELLKISFLQLGVEKVELNALTYYIFRALNTTYALLIKFCFFSIIKNEIQQ